MDDELTEWLYQVSLGKVPCDDRAIALIEASDDLRTGLATTAAHALVVAEYRQELAQAESDGDAPAATSLKRKIDLVEEEMFKLLEAL